MRNLLLLAALSCTALSFANSQTISTENYDFVGSHFLASYIGCDNEALQNIAGLAQAMEEASIASGASILKTSSHIFPPSGFTMVVLLSESHASIHTYPEFGACFVDLFTCGTRCSSERFHEVLTAYLKPETVSQKTLKRGQYIEEN